MRAKSITRIYMMSYIRVSLFGHIRVVSDHNRSDGLSVSRIELNGTTINRSCMYRPIDLSTSQSMAHNGPHADLDIFTIVSCRVKIIVSII